MQRKALGKGLGALLPAAPAPEEGVGERIVQIRIGDIRPNRYQPRSSFDVKLLEPLAESIRAKGVLQPVTVRASGSGRYELIAGERRWRAAKMAGLETLPAIVKEAGEAEMVELALVENLQRADLNPIEAALGYRRLIDEFHLTQEEVAQRVGTERSGIANHLRLLGLSGDIQEEIRGGRLALGHAKVLLSILDPETRSRLAREAAREGWPVRRLEQALAVVTPARRKKRVRTHDPILAQLEDRLRQRFGTKVRISGNGRTGRIQMDYYSMEELERLLELLLPSPGIAG